METQHWLDRWDNDQIGFHQDNTNPYLLQLWPQLGLTSGSCVFVPLCGKSLDMLWLRDQGHQVLGIELSRKAVAAFFAENGLNASVSTDARFERWQGDGITLLVGDFFDLKASDLDDCDAIYDRASLVALPPQMRQNYARHIQAIHPAGAPTLLISMEYPQAEMQGPPFSVEEQEVRDLYQAQRPVERLMDIDVLAENPQFRQRGLSHMHEKIYRLGGQLVRD